MKYLTGNKDSLDTLAVLTLHPAALHDFISCFLGKQIGVGAFRTVYENNLDPNTVIKIQHDSYGQSNAAEAILWEEVQGLMGKKAWVKKWFAPVHWISPCGQILCMSKTKISLKKKRPSKVPSFFHDAKFNNFGWLKGRYVCHDYGAPHGFINYKNKMKNIGPW